MWYEHQIYIRIPSLKKKEEGFLTLGVNHPSLSGYMTAHLLSNFLKFASKFQGHYESFNPFESSQLKSPEEALKYVYSTDIHLGYFERVFPLLKKNPFTQNDMGIFDNACKNPRRLDNDTGITVIDLATDTPKYCLMAISQLKNIHDDQKKNYEIFEPLSIDRYMNLYIPHYKETSAQICSCNICKEDEKTKYYHDKILRIFSISNYETIDYISSFDLLTKKEINIIFKEINIKE